MTSWTTNYREISKPSPRSVARSAALDALAVAGEVSGSTARALAKPRVQFMYLHHIFADEVAAFRDLLASLTKVMTPISYSDAVTRCIGGPIDRPYLAISFDDGFKNCLAASRVMDEFGIKGCFFVCPDVVSERDEARRVAFARERLHLPPIGFMNWEDLDDLRSRGHEIGNHTVGHPRLAELADPREPVEQGMSLLRLRYGDVRHFAWPYGSFNAITRTAVDAAFASGHASCASGVRGAHVAPAKDGRSLCIRRDHVIAAWPLRQVRYLLARSAAKATAADNDFPGGLR